MSVPKDQYVHVSWHLVPLQAPGEKHSEEVRTSSQGVRQKFEGSILLWFISFLEPLFHSVQIGVCLHSKEPRGQQHMAMGQPYPDQPLGCCSSPLGVTSGVNGVCFGDAFQSRDASAVSR